MVSLADTDILSSNDRIADWERRTRWVIVTAALAPFLVRLLPRPTYDITLAVDVITWAVFAFDLVVHVRISRAYLRGTRGWFDVAIVALTFPWYIVPAVAGTGFMIVFRWARLARLLFAGETGRRFAAALRRLGTLGIALAVTSLVSALIVLRHEPDDAGFDGIGDALWWSIVSFTTVGYGDLYPSTPEGRFAGAVMMFMGLMALGTVSAVLSSTFVADDQAVGDARRDESVGTVLAELKVLRDQVEELSRRLEAGTSAPAGPVEPTAPAGTAAASSTAEPAGTTEPAPG